MPNEKERDRAGRRKEGKEKGGKKGGRANHINQRCHHFPTGSSVRSKMSRSGNVLGCVPLTLLFCSRDGRRQREMSKKSFWGEKVNEKDSHSRKDLLGSQVFSTASPILVRPTVFSSSYPFKQGLKHSFASAPYRWKAPAAHLQEL